MQVTVFNKEYYDLFWVEKGKMSLLRMPLFANILRKLNPILHIQFYFYADSYKSKTADVASANMENRLSSWMWVGLWNVMSYHVGMTACNNLHISFLFNILCLVFPGHLYHLAHEIEL